MRKMLYQPIRIDTHRKIDGHSAWRNKEWRGNVGGIALIPTAQRLSSISFRPLLWITEPNIAIQLLKFSFEGLRA